MQRRRGGRPIRSADRHRVLVLARRAAEYRELVEAARLPNLEIVSSTSGDDLPEEAAACDLIFGDPSLVARVLPRMAAVRWVQATWAGVEPLLDPALRRDYVLTNARGVFGALMSEYVFGYLLAVERLVFQKYESQKAARWDHGAPESLRGKRIGLIGVGTIGAALARTAKHFGMHVKGFTRASEGCADVDEYFHAPIDRVLEAFAGDLDHLVTIAPNTSATRHVVDARFLAALPPRAIIVNPGRGSLIDERALVDALASGRLAGAVLDVFETEPLPAEHVLWRMPNVLITSHTAALSFPTDIAPLFIENYRRLVEGQPLKYVVDFVAGY